MKLGNKDRVVSTGVVLTLTVILVVLAVLQYRWSTQVSEAESDRMKANLQTAMTHFGDGLSHELRGIALALHFDSQGTDAGVYARQIEQWKQTAAYPELVANVYVWKAAGTRSRFLRLNTTTRQFEPCEGPEGLKRLTEPLQEFASHAAEASKRFREKDILVARSPHHPFADRQRQAPATLAATTPKNAEPGDSRDYSPTLRLPDFSTLLPPISTLARNDSGTVSHDDGTSSHSASDRQQTFEGSPQISRTPEQNSLAQRRRTGGLTLGRVPSSDVNPSLDGNPPVFSVFGGEQTAKSGSRKPGQPRTDSNLLEGDWRTNNGPRMSHERTPFERIDRVNPEESHPVLARQHTPVSSEQNAPEKSSASQKNSTDSSDKPETRIGAISADQRDNRRPEHPNFIPWFIEESVPALLRPQVPAFPGGQGGRVLPKGDWIVIELNKKVLQEHVFPDLTERYFSGPQGLIYDVAVRAEEPEDLIYSSGSGLGNQAKVAEDARLWLFGPPPGAPGGPSLPMRIFFSRDRVNGERPEDRPSRFGRRPAGPVLMSFQAGGSRSGWQLLAKHRKGSLEAAVASMRHRNLAISFGVLLILGVTMAMVIVTTRRAQRLATLQMDFVAGVSHELRTPLAVISSAADNIADGIVSDKAKLARYGKLIRDHTRQLTALVEQILSFAATRKQGQQYRLVRVQPEEIVESALHNSAEMIRNAGITVEREIAASMPAVLVDVQAATQCVQNLISNAVKYGGDQRWIGVRVQANDKEIQISIADKGLGMEAGELQRVFDPFYRTPAVVAAQIHGTGLGLALAKSMAEAMNGRLTVQSKPGKGSTFVLHMPCADEHALADTAAGYGS